jgi:hypothetical protein
MTRRWIMSANNALHFLVIALLATVVVLCGGCASIPLSTALSLSSLSPRTLAQIDPAQVRVRFSVPTDYEINIPESRLNLALTPSSGTRSGAMKLSLLGVTKESRPGGLFKADIPVSTYLLALSPEGSRQLQELQRRILANDPTGYEFSVSAPFSKVPANPVEVTFWADLKLSPTEPFMPLIDGAKIRFKHSPAGS